MSDPNIHLDGDESGAGPVPQPLGKSSAKQAEEAKKEAALAPDPLRRNPAAAPDPFDLSKSVVNQNLVQCCGSKTHLTIPVGKPGRQTFFRTHPDPEYRKSFWILEDKEDRKYYIVSSAIADNLIGEIYLATLYVCINKQNSLFVWLIRLPGEDGKQSDWHVSGHLATERAIGTWLRVGADMSIGAYITVEAVFDFGEPEWPDISYQEILRKAFRNEGIIDSLDHPAVQKLYGRIK